MQTSVCRSQQAFSWQVTELSKTLAVKTLQLEMEYIFAALEDEALDVAQGTEDAGFLLSRYRLPSVHPPPLRPSELTQDSCSTAYADSLQLCDCLGWIAERAAAMRLPS